MTVASTQARNATGPRQPGVARAISAALWPLAAAVFAQPVFDQPNEPKGAHP